MTTRILLADDHRLFREGLRALLEQELDMKVVGEAGDGRAVQALARMFNPHVVIMDLSMPQLNGIDATRQLVGEQPGVRVLGVSSYADRRYVAQMRAAGAAGYLLKATTGEELVRAIRTVREDPQFYLSPELKGVAAYCRTPGARVGVGPEVGPGVGPGAGDADGGAESSGFGEEDSYGCPLAMREREVLQLVAEGHTSLETAGKLGLSVKTIEAHRRNIMAKLDLHTVPALTKYAVRRGITSPEPC